MPLDPNTLVPSSGVIFGSWCQARFPEDSGASLEQIHYNFESRIGRKLHIVGTYMHFDDWNTSFPGTMQQNWANGGRLLFFRWKPDQAPGTARWQAIADGVYDTYLDAVFTKMKNWAGGTGTNALATNKFFLAFHHEWDGSDWQTWGEPGDTATQGVARYRDAFIHVKARRDAIGASNALLCWIVTGGSSTNQAKWLPGYPGDANVDYIGFEPYNSWNCLSGLNWRWPAQNWQTFLNWAQTNAPTPPIMIGEFGCTEHIDPNSGAFLTPSKADWFQDAVQGVIPTLKLAPYNRIKNVNYFHSAPSCPNWIDTTTASYNAFIVMANDPHLLPDMSVGSGGAGGAGTITRIGSAGNSANATSVNVTTPAGISNGDVIPAIGICSDVRTMTAPAGWTVAAGWPQTGGGAKFYVWTKDTVVSGDSSTAFTFNTDAANKIIVELGVWHSTNGFPSGYLDQLTFLAQDATDTTYTTQQITSTTDNSWGVAIFGTRGSSPTAWSPATGLTELQDIQHTSTGATTMALNDSNGSVGASGTNWGSFNETNISTNNGGGISFFLKPNVTAGGGGGTGELIFRDAATGSHASSATPTVTIPSATVAGDLITVGFTTSTITPTVTADPSGYDIDIRDHTNQRTRIYTKIAAGMPGTVSSDASTTVGPTLSTTGSKTTLFCLVYADPNRSQLVSNPSFEVDTSGWSVGGSVPPTLARSVVRAHHGTASGLITWGTGGTFPQIQTSLAGLVIGKQYAASAWVYVPATNPAIKLAIGSGPVGLASTVNDAWQQVYVEFTASSTLDNTLQVWPDVSPTSGQQAWVDEILVWPLPIEAIASTVETITQATHTTPAVTTNTNGCWIVNIVMDRGIAAGNTTVWTAPTGETKRAERYETGTSASTLIASDGAQENPPGTYGQKTFNSDLATTNAVMWTIAIAPAQAAAGAGASIRPGPIPIN